MEEVIILTVGNASSTIYSADGFNWNTGSKTITSSIATYYKASYGNNIFVLTTQEVSENAPIRAHNPKVRGSNPLPATS